MAKISVTTRRTRFRGIAAVTAVALAGVFTSVGFAAAVNTVAPAISGTAAQGQTLTVSTGTWTGTGAITYTYRWQRCNTDASACANITGAVANTYTLGSADVGNTVRAVVTATDATGPPTEAAAPVTAVVAAGAQPTITGTPAVGQTLTAVEGTVAGAPPSTYTYQWQRCDATGAACVPIPTAVGKTYVLTAADLGRSLRVVVTATNATGSSGATSVPSAVIAAGAPASLIKLTNGLMSVAAADVTGRERLILSSFRVNTALPIRSRKSFTVSFQVTDTRGYRVRDALVYLIGLPYNRIGRVPEAKTQQDGTVTLTLLPTRLQPLKLGARLVIFARARVAGQKLLTGASSRRLVEIVFGRAAP